MNCCAYKHEIELNQKSADQDLFNKQINQNKEEEVKRLLAEISHLESLIKSKEVDIEALNVTAEEQKVKIGEIKKAHTIEINDLKQKFNEKAEHLLFKNEALNDKIKELSEKIDLQEAVIQNFKSILK